MTFIDQAQLRERLVPGGKTIVADFTADWCPPCKAIAPELDILETRYTDVEFVKIDADANAELVNELGILGIPTVIRFSGGEEVARTTGAARADALAFRLKLDESSALSG
jgi:thioredoxin